MRKVSIICAAALAVLGTTDAVAQTAAGVPPEPGRFTVSINGGFQSSSQDISRSARFGLYDEEGQLDSRQNDIEGGGLFDIGGHARIRGSLGAGVAYTFVDSKGSGTVEAQFPHPLLFNQYRPFAETAPNLKHKERGFHFFATWHIPFTEKLDFTVSAGPSFFNMTQEFAAVGDLPGRVEAAEAPPFTSVNVTGITVISQKETAAGFNLGIDAIYSITPMFGAGGLIRFTRGSADFLVENTEVSLKAGGFQIGGGVRVRF